ncbi:MAG: hypothetical protein Q9183_006398 [Haloplaca sp. 2 TL-2023]
MISLMQSLPPMETPGPWSYLLISAYLTFILLNYIGFARARRQRDAFRVAVLSPCQRPYRHRNKGLKSFALLEATDIRVLRMMMYLRCVKKEPVRKVAHFVFKFEQPWEEAYLRQIELEFALLEGDEWEDVVMPLQLCYVHFANGFERDGRNKEEADGMEILIDRWRIGSAASRGSQATEEN